MVNRQLTLLILTLTTLWFCLPEPLTATDIHPTFNHLTVKDGLSHNQVFGVTSDNNGFLWFITRDGLCRYDGYSVRVFKHQDGKRDSLCANYINAIVKDANGYLWLGTQGGLCRFDPVWESFKTFPHEEFNPNPNGSREVETLYIDSRDILWIGTENGLTKYNPESGTIRHYTADPPSPESLTNNEIESIYEDSNGMIWVGTDSGLNRYDQKNDLFRPILSEPHLPDNLHADEITDIIEDRNGRLWIATDGSGLKSCDLSGGDIQTFRHKKNNPHSIAGDEVSAIYEDRYGHLWVGLDGDGLDLLDRTTGHFSHFKHDPANKQSLSFDDVKFFYEDTSGNLWICTKGGGANRFFQDRIKFPHILPEGDKPHVYAFYKEDNGTLLVGTEGGGILVYNSSSRLIRRIVHQQGNPNSLSSNRIRCILKDREGIFWVGTKNNGLNRLDPATGTITRFLSMPDTDGALRNKAITTLYEDYQGTLWIGTYSGLQRYDKKSEKFHHYSPGNSGNIDERILSIAEKKDGQLWVGTGKGLRIFHTETETFSDPYIIATDHTLLTHRIYALLQTEDGTLWAGTNGGLNRYSPENGETVLYTVRSGLPNDTVYGIIQDIYGCLWLSTAFGLTRYEKGTETFSHFTRQNGIQSPEFYIGAFHKGKDGEFLFGGKNGFNRFYPEAISDNPTPPGIMLTDFRIFEKRIRTERPLTALEKITLSHKDAFFSLEFAALHYADPTKNQYAYQLEGFDKDWIYSGTRRYAIYTNLDGGHYRFRVKAANNNGLWTESPYHLKINVLPPPWQTWWAYTAYGLLILSCFLLYARYQTRLRRQAVKSKNEELSREREMAEELDRMVRERTQALEASNSEIKRKNNIFRSFLKTFAIMNQTLRLEEFMEQTLVQLKNLFPDWDFALILEGDRPEIIKTAVFKNFQKETQNRLLANNRFFKDTPPEELLLKEDSLVNGEQLNWTILPLTGLGSRQLGKMILRGKEFTDFSKEVITIFMEQINAATVNKILADELERIANTDSLTKIFNRAYFERELDKYISQSKRFSEMHFAIVMMDINGLKRVNDKYGHEKGDELIVLASQMVVRACRASDIPVRLGGDELIILCPSTRFNGALALIERIRQMEAGFSLKCETPDGQTESIPVRLSIGVAASDMAAPDDVLGLADKLMYQDKKLFYSKEDKQR